MSSAPGAEEAGLESFVCDDNRDQIQNHRGDINSTTDFVWWNFGLLKTA
jgi:hypothetical protein